MIKLKVFFFFFKKEFFVHFIYHVFSVSYGVTSSSLSSPFILIFIWTSAAYMLLWDAAYYIYTLFGEFDFSLKIQVKHFTLDLYAEQFTEVRQTDWTCHSCTGCQRKVLFGQK